MSAPASFDPRDVPLPVASHNCARHWEIVLGVRAREEFDDMVRDPGTRIDLWVVSSALKPNNHRRLQLS